MLGNTPMMQQYQQIKSQYPDTILFFRLGDFYEMFGPDAEVAARELEITLTGREAGLAERVPMCGFPYHAADTYIARLIQKGYKIAICEQVEDPKATKGIVKREVVRVITPGTALESQLLSSHNSNYLAAITGAESDLWGLAVCDVSTGELWLSEYKGQKGFNILKDEVGRLRPSEVLVPKHDSFDYSGLFSPLEKPVLTPYPWGEFSYTKAYQSLLKHFKTNSLAGFGCQELTAALTTAAAVLAYVEETQKKHPQQIKTLKNYQPENYLLIDSSSARNLELTRTLRFNEKKGSLLDVIDKTKTAIGSRLLRNWLERPLSNLKKLEERLTAVEVLSTNWLERQTLRKSLEEIYDLERLLTRILYGRANPKELIAFKSSLAQLPQIKANLNLLTASQLLLRLAQNLDTLDDVKELLERALEEEPALSVKEGGVIKKGYNPRIDELREISAQGRNWIAALEAREREKTGIKSLKIGYNKVFGYYFEVTKANLSSVPPYFQRKQTLANGERYVTEELKNLEDQVLSAEEKLVALEEELYQNLLKDVGLATIRVQETSLSLAQIDVLQGLAETAVQKGYTRPELFSSDVNILSFSELRHPVVEGVLDAAAYVPNDLEMPEDLFLYVITGPNMAGKSTYCRSIALAVILAQMGSFVPAKRAQISLRDRVFARVGASDDLGSGQSTYMVEMNEVANILNNATARSLVVLDEVGRGTSTYDGLSMAWAVSEYLVKVLKAKTLFATHYHELTSLADSMGEVANLSVAVQEKGEEIIFLHKIVPGGTDRSYGIQVGRLAGLPLPVIKRAQGILKQLESDNLKAELREEEDSSFVEVVKDNSLEPQEREILAELAQLNVLSMTPLEALNNLYRFQEKLRRLEDLAAK